jgi:phosphoribosylformylglycinamidine synthase
MIISQFENESVPDVNEITPQVYKALHQAIKAKLIRSCHDLSEGGLAVAAAEMCIGGRLGLNLNLNLASHQNTRNLFGETTGCLLVEIASVNVPAFESIFKDLPIVKIGQATSDPILQFGDISIAVNDLAKAFNTPT